MTASRISGFSSVDKSPASPPVTHPRSTRRCTLPERVSGSVGSTSTAAGRIGLPKASARWSLTSPGSAGSPALPDACTTRTATSPLVGCAMPTAAAAVTPGTSQARASSSLGPTRFPAIFRTSSDRPGTSKVPSSNRIARSPWTQTPSMVRQYASR